MKKFLILIALPIILSAFHFFAPVALANGTIILNVKVNDAGQFDLLVGSVVKASSVGNEGTTGPVSVLPGQWPVSELASLGTPFGDYKITYGCSDGSSGDGSVISTVNVIDGQTITCTFDNKNTSIIVDTPTPTPTSLPVDSLTPTPTMVPNPTSTPALTATPTPIPTTASNSVSNSNTSSSNTSTNQTNNSKPAVCNDSKPGSAPFLKSAIVGENSVTISWTEAASPVSYYLVAYGLSPGSLSYGNPDIGGAGTTSYTIYGLSGGTKYYFKVRAGNGCTPGDYSNEISATPTGKFTTTPASGFKPDVLGAETEIGKQLIIPTVNPVGDVKGESTSNTNNDNFFLKYKWYLLAFVFIHLAIFVYYEKRFSDLKKRIH